jgi:hypothetical protein
MGPVGDGIAPDGTQEDWEANITSARSIAKRIMSQIDL